MNEETSFSSGNHERNQGSTPVKQVEIGLGEEDLAAGANNINANGRCIRLQGKEAGDTRLVTPVEDARSLNAGVVQFQSS